MKKEIQLWKYPVAFILTVAVAAVIAVSLVFGGAAIVLLAVKELADRTFDRIWEWAMEEPVT